MRGCTAPVAVTLDARRGELYTALYNCSAEGMPQLLREPHLEGPESWLQVLEAAGPAGALLVGDGALLYGDLFRAQLGSSGTVVEPPIAGPDMSLVARDVAGRMRQRPLETESLAPLYLRDHDGARAPGPSGTAIGAGSR